MSERKKINGHLRGPYIEVLFAPSAAGDYWIVREEGGTFHVPAVWDLGR